MNQPVVPDNIQLLNQLTPKAPPVYKASMRDF
jgi:hypothetical protein